MWCEDSWTFHNSQSYGTGLCTQGLKEGQKQVLLTFSHCARKLKDYRVTEIHKTVKHHPTVIPSVT